MGGDGTGTGAPSSACFPDNARAIAFYERHGFVREGLRRAQYRRGDQYHDEVLMARSLTPEA